MQGRAPGNVSEVIGGRKGDGPGQTGIQPDMMQSRAWRGERPDVSRSEPACKARAEYENAPRMRREWRCIFEGKTAYKWCEWVWSL
jgi:hypothetical protein